MDADILIKVSTEYDLTIFDVASLGKTNKKYFCIVKENIEYIMKTMMKNYNIFPGSIVHMITRTEDHYSLLKYYFQVMKLKEFYLRQCGFDYLPDFPEYSKNKDLINY